MVNAPSREVLVPTTTVKRIDNLAWVQESTRSEIVRAALTRFVATGFKGITPVPPTDDTARVRFSVDDQLWEEAGEKAWKLFTTRSEALRAILETLVEDVPVERRLASPEE